MRGVACGERARPGLPAGPVARGMGRSHGSGPPIERLTKSKLMSMENVAAKIDAAAPKPGKRGPYKKSWQAS